MALLETEGIGRDYRAGDASVQAVQDVTLRIARGESVAIMGRSGSGKSTLLNLLGCLDRPTSGTIRLDGVDVSRLSARELAGVRNRTIGFVFQGFNLLPRATALENVELPLLYAGGPMDARQRRRTALRALERVGLGARARHRPRQLSGGEQQRVAIARAIVNEPALLLADEPTGNLDTGTGAEIMRVFDELNRQGITLVIVTHDPGVAAACRREIVMQDGRITRIGPDRPGPEAGPPPSSAGEARPGRRPRRMLAATFRASARELWRNGLRSALTALGVIIGVGTIITMIGIGRGATEAVAARVASLGENVIMVERGSGKSARGVNLGSGTAAVLTVDDAQAIAAEVAEVAAVSPEVYVYEQLTAGSRNWNTKVYGEGSNYFEIRQWDFASGEGFSDAEARGGALVAVIGTTPSRELFGGEDPVGQVVRIKNVPFRIIGLLTAKGFSVSNRDQDDVIFVPYTTALRRLAGRNAQLHRINVMAAGASQMAGAEGAITALLRQRYAIAPGEDSDLFEVRSQVEIEKVATGTSRTMTWLLGALAMVSLIVGGVGIMNIMLVSVTERTREIGMRMAVGARPGDVLRQFLLESLTLSCAGGAAGITIGVVASRLVSTLAEWPTIVTLDAVAVAFVFSAAVGVTFGFLPALKAARLDPIEALRAE